MKYSAGRSRDQLFKIISQFETWEDFDLSDDEFLAALKRIEPFVSADGVRAFYRLYALRLGKSRWGDKTPGYCIQTAEVQSLLPEAHFIHIIRDGRDVALSVRPLWFAPGKDMASLARDWRSRIEAAQRLSHTCRRYLEVGYESLVADTEKELKRVCAFIELDYQPQMLRYFEGARARLDEVKPRYRPDGAILISKEQRLENQRFTSVPPEPARTFRWKREMTKEEKREFENVAGALLDRLGYER